MMDLEAFWRDILRQDEAAIQDYFHENAYINWHCTNEHFTVPEFIRANCEYPGDWDGEIEEIPVWGPVYYSDESLGKGWFGFFPCDFFYQSNCG